MMKHGEIEKQRDYYAQTASSYDASCAFDPHDEHFIAAAILTGLISHYQIESLLDVGCGTGRALLYLKNGHPNLRAHGVEPVAALREIAAQKGVPPDNLSSGDACRLDFPDASFDCVSAFGVLHHIPEPGKAILEMKRVARKAVFISDHNIYGMGSTITRGGKQAFRMLKLKQLLKFVMTRGKGFHDTNWDGVFYPFSMADYVDLICANTKQGFTFSTKSPSVNLLRNASHIAVFAVK